MRNTAVNVTVMYNNQSRFSLLSGKRLKANGGKGLMGAKGKGKEKRVELQINLGHLNIRHTNI
jgi:hypothetical protein